MTPTHPAYQDMRMAVEALALGPGPIQGRLQAAERFFRRVAKSDMGSMPEQHLEVRIGAALVEAGEETEDRNDTDVADSIARLDAARAAEIAGDMVRLYEVVAGLREDDGYNRWD